MQVAMHGEQHQVESTHVVGPAGRLRHEGLSNSDRTIAMWIHLSPLIAFLIVGPLAVIAPLVLWLTRKDESTYIDDHGREVMNLCITTAIVCLFAVIPIIGWLLGAIWFIVQLINVIRGSIAANAGEYFRYPMTLRLIS